MASQLSLNGAPVLGGWLSLPRVGLWTAELTLPDAVALAAGDVATLTPEAGTTLTGAVASAGVYADTTRVRVVGGAGGLARKPPPQTYRDLTVGEMLAHTLGLVGERLAASTDASVSGAPIDAYSRLLQSASSTVAFWADALGVAWRALPDGSIWLGADAFLPAPKSFPFLVVGTEPETNADVLAPDAIEPLAGLSLTGRPVAHVTYQVGAALRAEVLYEWT